MRPLSSPPSPEALLEVRPADADDRGPLSNLVFSEPHVHKHLDWKAPLEWLGFSPFMVLQDGARLVGALACPPDPESIAWVRLFVFASNLNGFSAWRPLWLAARQELAKQGGGTAAVIATQRWLDPILLENGFELVNHIVLFEMNTDTASGVPLQQDREIRPMLPADLPQVAELDWAAFEPLWRNSLAALTHAYAQATYASVAEEGSGLVGYQLSTGGMFGTHLARLAVRPGVQRRGLGAALVRDLIAHIPAGREPRLTVNTQADNSASHTLYARLGFRETGERFPVYAFEVEGTSRAHPQAGGGN